jgi:hypothetical protein
MNLTPHSDPRVDAPYVMRTTATRAKAAFCVAAARYLQSAQANGTPGPL